MTEGYMVRCTAAAGRAMSGIYSAGLTANGMIATWKQERATRFDSKTIADGISARLTRKFSDTTWETFHA